MPDLVASELPELNIEVDIKRSVTFSTERKIQIGEYRKMLAHSEIGILFLKFDIKKNSCFFIICHEEQEVVKSGWVQVGNYFDFSEELTGSKGLQLKSLEGKEAIVKICWAE